jgi:hypothetical protein
MPSTLPGKSEGQGAARAQTEEEDRRADKQELTASSREEFFKDCKSGGKYDGIVGIYRHNDSAQTVGVFDNEFI